MRLQILKDIMNNIFSYYMYNEDFKIHIKLENDYRFYSYHIISSIKRCVIEKFSVIVIHIKLFTFSEYISLCLYEKCEFHCSVTHIKSNNCV